MKPSRIRDREIPRREEEDATPDEGKPSFFYRLGRAVGRGLRGARNARTRAANSLRRRSGNN